MINKEKQFSRKAPSQHMARTVESIFSCKWSLTVYQLLEHGINRPGEMVRNVEGLSTKVLNDCLRRNIEFGVLRKIAYNEVPPRVEYVLTPYGEKFVGIIDQLEQLHIDINAEKTAQV